MRRPRKDEHPVPGWFVTFADMMSLLLAFFILLQIFSELKKEDGDYRRTVTAIREAFGNRAGGGFMPVEDIPASSIVRQLEDMVLRQARERHSSQAPTESLDGVFLRVRTIREGLAFTMGGPTAFDEGSADLKPAVIAELRKLAVLLAGRTNKVIVRGHAAAKYLPEGSPWRDLDDLSYARARNVLSALVGLGLDDQVFRLEPVGIREPLRPRAARASETAENRRVEVILSEELVDQTNTDADFTDPDRARRGTLE